MIGKHLLEQGVAQVAEWAEAYVLNETGIPECPSAKLSDKEKAGLLLIEIMLKAGAE